MNTLLLISIFVSLFCVGLRIISSKGILLYFLRRPYDLMENDRRRLLKKVTDMDADIFKHIQEIEMLRSGEKRMSDNPEISKKIADQRIIFIQEYIKSMLPFNNNVKKKVKQLDLKIGILKPIIGCGTCMSSFWVFIFWFPCLTLTNLPIDSIESYWGIVPVMFITATFNSIILAVYDLIKIKQECNCK